MLLTLALLVQATATPVGTERLSVVPRACPCGPSVDGEVVVCGHPSDQRLHPLPPLPDARHIEPTTLHLPGIGTARLHAIHTALPGAEGNGVAVTLTVPFGKPKVR